MKNMNKEFLDSEREFLDLEHKYMILVPLNEDGLEELYQYNIYKDGKISENMKAMSFYEDTYSYMEDRLFDFINLVCGSLINMYEEEVIENNQLEKVLDITNKLIHNNDDEHFVEFAKEFKSLIELAIEKKTVVGFYF